MPNPTTWSAVPVLLLLAACGNKSPAPAEAATGAEQLVQRHCTRCHLAPAPADLSREYWPYALHYMGNYVGMKGDEFPDMRVEGFPPELEPVQDYTKRYFLHGPDGYFRDLYPFKLHIPPAPQMSADEFRVLREYYLSAAKPAAAMRQQEPKPPLTRLFAPMEPPVEVPPDALILSTLVDPAQGRLYVGKTVVDDWVAGGERRAGFDQWDELLVVDLLTGRRLHTQQLASDPIDMAPAGRGVRVVTHGRFPMSSVGLAQVTDWTFAGGKVDSRVLVDRKQRFVEQAGADMNGDGRQDIVGVAFGDGIFDDAQSLLAIWYDTPAGLRESVVAKDSGLISFAIADFNSDGRRDIGAVIAQGRQETVLYVNEGNERYRRHVVAAHGPAWGGNSVRAADFDGDGDPDLLVLNGDNVAGNGIGQVVPAPRPHHGIRFYRNDGGLTFSEVWYRRMHGAIRSVVRDFDGDGDADVAAIALFPEWSEAEPETFVYLENHGGFRFAPQSLPPGAFGVWASIESADVNADGRADIVLGLGNFPELVPKDWITAHPARKGRGDKANSILFLVNQGGAR
ncbi:MAG: VCBS repeat-containing protein [Gammaproteobacteria bacterium]|nr:VCBS repeat-containing protein [Gammaproteobacteria bacterium]